MVCHNCGREINTLGSIGRKDECPHCDADMHCCKNCRFFDPGKSNQCNENQADYVKDKSRANFCEFFQADKRVALTKKSSSPTASKDDVKKSFDSLFKK